MALFQKTSGTNSASFAIPISTAHDVLVMVAGAQDSSGGAGGTITDNAGNTWPVPATSFDVNGRAVFIVRLHVPPVAFQTVTWNPSGGWSVPAYIWAYEIARSGAGGTNMPQPFNNNYGVSNAENLNSNNFVSLPHAPVAPLSDGTPGGPPTIQGQAGVQNFYAVVEASNVSQGSINSPWTLDVSQGGFSAAYIDDLAGAGANYPTVWGSSAASYCSESIVLATSLSPVGTGKILVTKATSPSGDSQEFTFNPSWTTSFVLTDGQSELSGDLAPGTYSITEDVIPGWNTETSINPTSIEVVAGETSEIIFTNTFLPSTVGNIRVRKVTNPTGSLQAFTFQPSWTDAFSLSDGESELSDDLSPGSYSISEDAVAGWTAAPSLDPTNIVVVAGVTTEITFTNTLTPPAPIPHSPPFGRAIAPAIGCVAFSQAVVRDGNDEEQMIVGGPDGNLYLLYSGSDDNGSAFEAEALALRYVGPERTAVKFLEWYGDQLAQWFISRRLNTDFTLSEMNELTEFGSESVQGEDGDNHWRVPIATPEMIHAYVLLKLASHAQDGSTDVNIPPHMPVEDYGRVWMVTPLLGASRGK